MKSAALKLCPRQPAADVRSLWFGRCCLFIALTSLADAALVLLYSESILYLEANPLCAALMKLEPRYFSVFLVCKLIGTGLVLLTMYRLLQRERSIAVAVAGAVAAFQLTLMLYQCFA